MDKYILKDHVAIPEPDLFKWGDWFETAERHVALTQVTPDVKVSTVFLGLDHSWDSGPPLLYKTMIFGGSRDGYQERYETWSEAEAGHKKAVELAEKAG